MEVHLLLGARMPAPGTSSSHSRFHLCARVFALMHVFPQSSNNDESPAEQQTCTVTKVMTPPVGRGERMRRAGGKGTGHSGSMQ